MKNRIVIGVLMGLSVPAFGAEKLNMWISRTLYTDREIRRLEDKYRADMHASTYFDYQNGVYNPRESQIPSNAKLWDFEKLFGGKRPYDYSMNTMVYGDQYVYQKPGKDKQGRSYAPRLLKKNAPQKDIDFEIRRRQARLEKIAEKINYLKGSWLDRAFYKVTGRSPYHPKVEGKPVKDVSIYEQWEEGSPRHHDKSYFE